MPGTPIKKAGSIMNPAFLSSEIVDYRLEYSIRNLTSHFITIISVAKSLFLKSKALQDGLALPVSPIPGLHFPVDRHPALTSYQLFNGIPLL